MAKPCWSNIPIRKHNGEAGWFLPDASIRYLEHPDAAAQRVLRDQLRLSDQQPSISHIESFVGNDGSWHLSFHYLLPLEALPDLKPSEIIGSAEWFELSALPKASEIAHHGWALKTIKKIRPSLKRS